MLTKKLSSFFPLWKTRNVSPPKELRHFRLLSGTEHIPLTDVQGKTISTAVYELVKNSTFALLFNHLAKDELASLCLTEEMILQFIKKHRHWLRSDGCATFFLCEKKGTFFVTVYRFYRSGSSTIQHFELYTAQEVWGAKRQHRLVVPR